MGVLTASAAPAVSPTHYYRDGKAYRRVTTVLDMFSGKSDSGAAAAKMTASGLARVIEEVAFGIVHPQLQDHADDLAGFFATDDGKRFVSGRYFAEIGAYADMGTLVDLALQEVLQGNPAPDWVTWAQNQAAAMNESRKLTALEYTQAEEAKDWAKVRELSGAPRFPVMVDFEDCAQRIKDGEGWLALNDVTPVAWQVALYDDALMVAGTPDCVALLPDGRHWVIDFKTSNNCPKPSHGAQVVKYGDMWESQTQVPVGRYTAVYFTDKGAKPYDVKDIAACRAMFHAALTMADMGNPFARQGSTALVPGGLL